MSSMRVSDGTRWYHPPSECNNDPSVFPIRADPNGRAHLDEHKQDSISIILGYRAISLSLSLSFSLSLYIYIYRCITYLQYYVYIYIYIYTYTHITHIYIYIYRERERERERHINSVVYLGCLRNPSGWTWAGPWTRSTRPCWPRSILLMLHVAS